MDADSIQATIDEVVTSLTQSNIDHLRHVLSIALLLPLGSEVTRYLSEEISKLDVRQELLEAVADTGTRHLHAVRQLLDNGFPTFPTETVPPEVLAAIHAQNEDLRAIEDLFHLTTVSSVRVLSEVGPEIPQ